MLKKQNKSEENVEQIDEIVYKSISMGIFYMYKLILFIHVFPSTYELRVQMILPKHILICLSVCRFGLRDPQAYQL